MVPYIDMIDQLLDLGSNVRNVLLVLIIKYSTLFGLFFQREFEIFIIVFLEKI